MPLFEAGLGYGPRLAPMFRRNASIIDQNSLRTELFLYLGQNGLGRTVVCEGFVNPDQGFVSIFFRYLFHSNIVAINNGDLIALGQISIGSGQAQPLGASSNAGNLLSLRSQWFSP